MSRSRRSSYTSTYFSALKLASVLCVSAVGAGAGAAGAAGGASARAASARIAGAAWQSLDSSSGTAWTATPGGGVGGAVPAVVPGDLISDLARAGAIADPWRDLTWRAEAGRWDLQAWEFAADFATPAWAADGGRTLLVFDSVKLAADATLNGAPLALARSQHLRSALDVTAALARGAGAANALRVVFPPTVNDTRNDDGRFQGCSGGWDWAPYSNETTGRTPKGIRTMSKGLVQSVYLTHAAAGGALIVGVKPLVWYLGPYPTAPLTDASAGGWRVDVVVYILSPAGTAAGSTLRVSPAWGGAMSVPVGALAAGVETAVNVSLAVAPGTVSLWWPNTMQTQRPLYDINVSFTAAGGSADVVSASRVGFRTLALVTADDSDPSKIAGVPGSGALTMRLKVNGADLAVRGANWIPLEELSARVTDEAHAAAVASAAAASMSMLRIWGGGLYPNTAFLDAADEQGVLLFVDAMYASQDNSHHFAADTPEQRAELAYNVRRLAAHPAVALYDACNECGGSGAFVDFVAPSMAAEDPTRPIWPSSPSPGWADGVDRLWGTPLAGRSLRILESTAPVAPVPGCNCTGQTGVFYYGFPLSPFLSPVPVADAAACCALCSATADCALGNYQHGGCQLIAPPLAPLPRDSSCVAVFPQGGAVAPLPVPANLVAEVHGPYQGGGGWPTVNGGGPPASAFDAQLPPALASASTPYGTQAPGTFTSEFGVGQPASFEIMAPTLSPTYYSMHGGDHPADTCTGGFAHVCTGGNVMAQRNYGGDDAWRTYFPGTSLNITLDDAGAAPFAAQLYLVQLATTLDLQSTVEVHRSSNRWGLLTWQLGEVWQSYGWGSLEYSSGAGSVLGGRWKPSHYMLARAYGNVAVACSAAASCFVKNDDALAALPAADVIVAAVHLRDGATVQLGRARLSLPRGANAVAWLCASGGAATPPASCPSWAALLPAAGCAASGADCVITTSVVDAASGEQRAANSQLLVVPGHLNASRAVRVTAVVGDADPADGSVPVMLTAAGDGAAPALFTMLFTEANGRFDDNFLTLLPAGGAPTVLRFLPSAPGQRDVLASTLRISTLGEQMNPPPPPRPAKGSCTTRADTDVNDDGKFLPGATLADCCALCWADPSQQCLAAAFNPASPGCWLKYGTDFVPRTGIQTCVLDI